MRPGETLQSKHTHVQLDDELYNLILDISTDRAVKPSKILRQLFDETLDSLEHGNTKPLFSKNQDVSKVLSIRLSKRLHTRLENYAKKLDITIRNLTYNLVKMKLQPIKNLKSEGRKTA